MQTIDLTFNGLIKTEVSKILAKNLERNPQLINQIKSGLVSVEEYCRVLLIQFIGRNPELFKLDIFA